MYVIFIIGNYFREQLYAVLPGPEPYGPQQKTGTLPPETDSNQPCEIKRPHNIAEVLWRSSVSSIYSIVIGLTIYAGGP